MDIAGESSGTWLRRALVDAVVDDDAEEVPCVKLVKWGINIGDNRPGSDAGVSKELAVADPGSGGNFSTFESPTRTREKSAFVR